MKLDMEMIGLINAFEKLTRARSKDCFIFRERLTFVVEQGDLKKALGKDKSNVERLEKLLNRKVKIVEYSPHMTQFIINLLQPLKVLDIVEDEGIVVIKGPDTKTKGLMIGARAQNLRAAEGIVRKYFECKEIKVV